MSPDLQAESGSRNARPPARRARAPRPAAPARDAHMASNLVGGAVNGCATRCLVVLIGIFSAGSLMRIDRSGIDHTSGQAFRAANSAIGGAS